ncbi:MAG: hypothetical protein RI958_2540 [Actinomycetota bacterium]
MTLRLTIDRVPWGRHVDSFRASVPHLVPVVKGNGYGFGRRQLAAVAASWADTIAVGTLYEAADLHDLGVSTIVSLTPALDVPHDLPPATVPTVAGPSHVRALRRAGWRGRVAVKLASSMHRYGVTRDRLDELAEQIRSSGCEPALYVIHPPLAVDDRSDSDAAAEIEAWLELLDPSLPISVSHVSPEALSSLAQRWPGYRWNLRSGTALWHGDKSFLRLDADVIDIDDRRAGDRAGYRGVRLETDARLTMIGAGSAHGVAPLVDGRSPFHFGRRRLALLEPPHMHTSMAVVPPDQPQPDIGDRVDVQRPLITAHPDLVVWR